MRRYAVWVRSAAEFGELVAHLLERGREAREAFFFLGNHQRRRLGDETLVGELAVCLGGFRLEPRDFLCQPFAFGGDVGRSLATDGQLGWGEYLGGYALSFAAVWIAVALVGLIVRRLAHEAGLSGLDRLFGFGLGVVRGVFFACVLVLLMGFTSMPREPQWRSSQTMPVFEPGARWLRSLLPAALRAEGAI